jgi:hypothetical protein
LVEKIFDDSGFHFASLVVERLSMCIQHEDVWNGACVILLHQLLLFGRALNVKIDDHKMHLRAVLVVLLYCPSGLPLRVKASFAVHDYVVDFPETNPDWASVPAMSGPSRLSLP